MRQKIENLIELPSGVTATLTNGVLTVKGPKGEAVRKMFHPLLIVKVNGNKISITAKMRDTKREKRMANTFEAHIKNMTTGVQTPYTYVLKVCSGHFPMNVSISGEQFVVKNFLGEKSPRTIKLKKGVTVKIDGEKITVESCDKELAGQMASDIELITAKRNRDLRVFQDGIYMVEKAGEVLS